MTLAKEGEKRNIKCNTICPFAGTRMSGTVLPKEVVEAMKPDFIAPFVGLLAHEKCPENGQIYEVVAGYIGKLRYQRAEGHLFVGDENTSEEILKKYNKITNFDSNFTFPTANAEFNSQIYQEVTARTAQKQQAKQEGTSSGLKSDEIFGMMATYLAQG